MWQVFFFTKVLAAPSFVYIFVDLEGLVLTRTLFYVFTVFEIWYCYSKL